MQVQQGDTLYETVKKLPDGCVKVKPKSVGYVVMHGENGHIHVITETSPDICELYEKDGVLYVRAIQTTKINHDEHNVQTLEPGIWKVGQVNEFDYLQKMTRKVID